MFEINVKTIIDEEKGNQVFKKNINLDANLDAFVLVSSSDNVFAENILNYTIEHLIDKISKEDTYHDLSTTLEGINAFIKTWKIDSNNKALSLDMAI
ncbi:MAG: hypothetical protein LBQ24_07540 [Candidatus Peribacteria bacterium]|jgi:hypothetical protein|nr:hypothetical protein [Candidatus Peribacteria bacterium]